LAERLASDASPAVRREVALSLRDVPFEKSGSLLVALARGYDGKDRSYLEAWGIGATHKESALYSALKAAHATQPWVGPSWLDLVWRLTPAEAVPELRTMALDPGLWPASRSKVITALGFIPTKESAQVLLDVAEKGERDLKTNPALWWLLNYKDTRWADAGIDAELKRRKLFDPDAVTVSESLVPEPGVAKVTVADVAKLRGNAKRGAVAVAACRMCHRVGGDGAEYGPDINGFAGRQTKEVVITALVNPSNDIAHGYEGTQVTLVDARRIHGMVLSGGNPLIIQSTGGVTQMIPAGMIKERKRLGRSLMLSADQLGLTAQQIADIVEYLK
ncbi:MAG TPA: hypothetical protein VFO82_15020, partial [Steroidobacteraceae bacterium]|nr:hypothetical protein [Steroidobacteraceae bacterium]